MGSRDDDDYENKLRDEREALDLYQEFFNIYPPDKEKAAKSKDYKKVFEGGNIVNIDDDRIVIEKASDIECKPIEWLWNGWLGKGKVHIIAGAPGAGKTTIALALASVLTVGGRWPDGSEAEYGDVMMWSGEDAFSDTIVPKFDACGGDRDRLLCIRHSLIDGNESPFNPADQKHMEILVRNFLAYKYPPKILIIDPVIALVAGDSHKNAEVRQGLSSIVRLAEQFACSVIGIHHLTKNTAGRDPLERVTGSLAFGAVARIVMMSVRNRETDQRLMVRIKSNIGPDGGGFEYDIEPCQMPSKTEIDTVRLTFGDVIDGSARDIIDSAEGEKDSKLDFAKDFIVDRLKDGPKLASVMMLGLSKAGVSERTAKRAKKAAKVESYKEGYQGDWYWKLLNNE